MKKLKKIIAILLAAAALTVAAVSACAEPLVGESAAAGLISAAEASLSTAVDLKDYHDFVYLSTGEDCGFDPFLRLARSCALVFAGTFADSNDADVQLQYLTGEKGCFCAAAGECFQLGGGSEEVRAGDFIFWFDESGRAVRAGLTVWASGEVANVIVFSGSGRCAKLTLSTGAVRNSGLSSAMLVRPDYPSNEEIVFDFLRNEVGATSGGACGAMANIYWESSFRSSESESVTGEGFGICQWSYERKPQMEEFCISRGFDINSLEGQLYYMKHELQEDFPELNMLLCSSEDSADGAFDAAYWWCYDFEHPSDRNDTSAERGIFARDVVWKVYGEK